MNGTSWLIASLDNSQIGAVFRPNAAKALGQAFDEGWAEIAGNFGHDPSEIDKAGIVGPMRSYQAPRGALAMSGASAGRRWAFFDRFLPFRANIALGISQFRPSLFASTIASSAIEVLSTTLAYPFRCPRVFLHLCKYLPWQVRHRRVLWFGGSPDTIAARCQTKVRA